MIDLLIECNAISLTFVTLQNYALFNESVLLACQTKKNLSHAKHSDGGRRAHAHMRVSLSSKPLTHTVCVLEWNVLAYVCALRIRFHIYM